MLAYEGVQCPAPIDICLKNEICQNMILELSRTQCPFNERTQELGKIDYHKTRGLC